MANICFLTKKYHIRCSHQLLDCKDPRLKTKETSVHGHNMDVLVTFKSPIDKQSGLIIDRDHTDQIINNTIVQKYDQSLLNNFLTIPTGENLVIAITEDILKTDLANKLHQVQLKETNKNFFSGPICNE